MKLLIDLGNSRVKWAWCRGRDLVAHGVSDSGSTEFEARLKRAWEGQPEPSQVVYCAVACQARAEQLESLVRELWQLQARRLIPERQAFGLRCHYHQPDQLGADRWAAMIGAFVRIQDALCVVDCGTAVTVDALAADGRHQGGMIIPGVVLMRKVLGEQTGRIGPVDDGNFALTSVDTRGAVSTGCVLAVAAFIDRAIQAYQDMLAGTVQVLITGGDAQTLMPYLESKPERVPDLVLLGLAEFAELDS